MQPKHTLKALLYYRLTMAGFTLTDNACSWIQHSDSQACVVATTKCSPAAIAADA
jgi:hypothetical protein